MQFLHKSKLTILFLIFQATWMMGQEFTLSGYMRDATSGEELLYANILVKETGEGVNTNLYGFYSLTLPKGTYTVEYSYVGYEPQTFELRLEADVRKDIELGSGAQQLAEVVVTSKADDENVSSTEVGTFTMDVKDMKLIPVLMGEQDILKSVQLMPGVASSGEGGNGFFVRGGNLDQNLILLDEAPVYNASHMLGFFSVFNSDALKDVKMYKSGIPAEYGGRASSVMDIRMKNGNMKEYEVSGGIGLIASRATVEGLIVKDKGSFIVSGRRTYLDLVLNAVSDEFDGSSLYFYDLNLKANYKLGDNDRIFLSGYLGRDAFGTDDFGFDWGNKTATLRWNHLFNDKLFANTSVIFSDYNYGFKFEDDEQEIALTSGIVDYTLKQDYNYYLNPKNSLRFGFSTIYHQFQPGDFTNKEDGITEPILTIQEQQALESGIYVGNEQKINEKLTVNYGLRFSIFNNIGAYSVKEYDAENDIIETTDYEKGKFYNTYTGFEPRVNATYLLNSSSSVKASYNRINQYLHLLSNSTSGSPTDLWTPSSPNIKPQIADQYSVGYFKNFGGNAYELSIEGYYKNLQNQVDYEDGANTLLNENVEAELVYGEGYAYGAEVLVKKTKGRFTGWLGYSFSKSKRRFDEINNGDWFSARQDRTHDISLVASYKLNDKLNLSGSFVYYTGDAVTFPSGKYEIDGGIVNLYSERNGYRMPDYHRLDVGLTWILKDTERYKSDLNFSIYNVYNRKNAYTISFRESEDVPNTTEAVRLALFGAIPSVTWNFKF